jgi:outer membrane receptor protein involved in Fe transport
MTFRNRCRRVVLGSAIAAVLPATAYAQAADESALGDSEIVVTAQKRQERLLDVPVSITAVTSDTLVEQNLVRVSDYFSRIPGLQYAGNRVTNLSLRGVASGGTTNPTVSIVIDDVQFGSSTYQGQQPIPDFDPGTLARIEVLRGPQGTLYGASSLGGIIKYVTTQPDTREFSGRVEVGTNSSEGGKLGWSARGSVNIPIIEDRVALSVSGYFRDDPRWFDNVSTSAATLLRNNANMVKTWGGRASLLVKPFDGLTIVASALRQRQNTGYLTTERVCPECTTVPTTNTNFTSVFGEYTNSVAPASGQSRYSLYTLRGELDLGSVDVTSISAWGESQSIANSDVSVTFSYLPPIYAPGGTVVIGNGDKSTKFSQELRLSGKNDMFDWMVGGFYTKEHAAISQALSVYNSDGSFALVPFSSSGPSTYEEKAAFGAVTVHLTDKFDIQFGGRYAENQQTYFSRAEVDPGASAVLGVTRVNPLITSKENAFTWLVSPSYHINDDLMIYGRVATGYRPGGPNTSVAPVQTYASDSVTNYELGLKGYLFDRLLSIDVSAFLIDWNDIQLQNTAVPSNFTYFTNASKARTRGIEAAATIKPWTGFAVEANATVLDAKLVSDIPGVAGATVLNGKAGDRLPYSAKFTANISLQQDFDLSEHVSAFVGGNLSYVGQRFSEFTSTAASAVRPRISMPAYTVVDLRFGASFKDVGIQVNAYVRNLFGARGVVTATNRNGAVPPNAVFLQPTTYGVTLAKSF